MKVVSRLIEPPSKEAVTRAVDELVALEALTINTKEESLTPLGVHLSTLPVDVRIGKLILFGAMFNVVDEALTIAANPNPNHNPNPNWRPAPSPQR